jgi:flagellar basal body-associated protein FliL
MLKNKWVKISMAVLVLAFLVFGYIKYFYVFASGTKAGVLNTFQKKGYVFKTWEGIIIQSGFKMNVQSNEFEFSVTNEKIAMELEKHSGKEVNLHYKRYFGTLPWRGVSEYVVDSIFEVRNTEQKNNITPQ